MVGGADTGRGLEIQPPRTECRRRQKESAMGRSRFSKLLGGGVVALLVSLAPTLTRSCCTSSPRWPKKNAR